MGALVKARRHKDGRQYAVQAVAFPCKKLYPGAKVSRLRLTLDTAAERTFIRRQGLRGEVKGKPGGLRHGIAGPQHAVAVELVRVHLLFEGEDGWELLTADVDVYDVPERSEDGCLGVDLLARLELDGTTATAGLAATKEEAAAVRASGPFASVERKLGQVEAWESLSCECHRYLKAALKDS